MPMNLKCRHCYWLKRSKKGKGNSCYSKGMIRTSHVCDEFELDFFGLPPIVKRCIHLMGRFKTHDLPIVAHLSQIQKRINGRKKLQQLRYKVGDEVYYRYFDKVLKLRIHHMDEEHVYGETAKGKHLTLLHGSIVLKDDIRPRTPLIVRLKKRYIADRRSSNVRKKVRGR